MGDSRATLVKGIAASAITIAATAVGALIRVPLTISAVGVAAYGVISTITSVYAWLGSISAGARLASSSLAAPLGDTPEVLREVTHDVTAATWRVAAPLGAVAVAIALFLPLSEVIDPEGQLSTGSLKAVLVATVVIALTSIYGGARLGALTTFGYVRLQNLSVLISLVITTGLTWLGAREGWPAPAFALVWLVSIAVPALPASLAYLHDWVGMRRSPRGTRQDVGSVVSSGLWISGTQQLQSGFDLLIISGVLGSYAAAEYALVFRLIQVVVAPMIGAAPVITRFAGLARAAEGRGTARKTCGRTVVGSLLLELVLVLLFLASLEFVVALLSGQRISVAPSLLIASGVWCVLEVVRRGLMALTATPQGMRVWRRANVWASLPNVALSVVLTLAIGVAGPLVATCAATLIMVVIGAWLLRADLREVFGQ